MELIERICREIEGCLENYKPSTIILECQSLHSNEEDNFAHVRKLRTYSQLSVNEKEAQRFVGICKILKILYKHLQTNNEQTTIRDIYYQDVQVFCHKQSECQFLMKQLVEDCLGLSLYKDFNIHPTQKGLVFGDFFDVLKPKAKPMLIPIDFKECFSRSLQTTRITIIIVEKDSVFQYLCSYLSRHGFLLTNFLVVTAKGYSDCLTLRFLVWLQENFECGFFGFFDSDVYGINIYKQYRGHLKTIQFSGTFLTDSDPSSWLLILDRDIAVMLNLCNTCHEIGADVKRELTRGLFLFRKAEINVTNIDDDKLNYVDYIIAKVEERNYSTMKKRDST